MTLTMEISPDAEAHLRFLASQQGEEENSLAARLLTELLTEDVAALAEVATVVQTGLANLDAGDRGVLLEEYRTQIQAAKGRTSSEAA